MPTKTKAIPASYLALITRFPLKVITSDKEYARTITFAAALDSKAKLDKGQVMYLDALLALLASYNIRR